MYYYYNAAGYRGILPERALEDPECFRAEQEPEDDDEEEMEG